MTHHTGSDEGRWLCSTAGGVTTAHDTKAAAEAEQTRLGSSTTSCVWFCSQIEPRESA